MFKKKNKGLFKRKSKLKKFYCKNEIFIKYCFVSFVCTCILYLVFYLVNLITKGNYLLANFLSYAISFTVLFFWNRKVFNYKPIRRKDRLEQTISFVIIRAIGFPLDSFILFLLIKEFNIGNMTAKVLASLIMFMYNYITNKLFVYKERKRHIFKWM